MTDKKCGYSLVAALISFAAALVFLLPGYCFAETGPSAARSIYNNIMLVINFGILVFFFVKYARKPLLNFLVNERVKIEDKMSTLENQFLEVKAATDEEADRIKNIEQYLQKMKEDVLEMGRTAKENIVEEAKAAASLMIENAQAYAGYQVAKAKKALSDQMVDIAAEIVEERLIRMISENDNEKLVSQFVAELKSKNVLA